jgi:hypothetical protein
MQCNSFICHHIARKDTGSEQKIHGSSPYLELILKTEFELFAAEGVIIHTGSCLLIYSVQPAGKN